MELAHEIAAESLVGELLLQIADTGALTILNSLPAFDNGFGSSFCVADGNDLPIDAGFYEIAGPGVWSEHDLQAASHCFKRGADESLFE